jgi:hypothetical protein
MWLVFLPPGLSRKQKRLSLGQGCDAFTHDLHAGFLQPQNDLIIGPSGQTNATNSMLSFENLNRDFRL